MAGKWQYPHRRWNPLRQSWVMVSPHRTQRPWQGEVAQKTAPSAIHYDPACYLCPGNQRAGGAANPQYDLIFTFVNDYAALLPDVPTPEQNAATASPLLIAEPARGLCRVLCFHPDHSLTLARMTQPEIRRVVDAWTSEYEELGAIDWIQYVQVFENRGAMMGASNPHPHGQIWSTGSCPMNPPRRRLRSASIWRRMATACYVITSPPSELPASGGVRERLFCRCSCHGGRCGHSRCCW